MNANRIGLIGLIAISTGMCIEAAGAPVSVDVRPQPLIDALNDWAQQTGYQVIVPASAAGEGRAPALKGEYSCDAALQRLLTGTKLDYRFVNARTVTIEERTESRSSDLTYIPQSGEIVRLAQLESSGDPPVAS